MYCSRCGRKIENNFCAYCGIPVQAQINNMGGYIQPIEKKRLKNWQKVLLILAAVVIGICFFVIAVNILGSLIGSSKEENKTGEVVPSASSSHDSTENAEQYETGIELSQDLMDFTVRIDGVVYQLPMELSAFEKNGWRLAENFDKNAQVASEHYASTYLEKDGYKLDIELVNMSKDMINVTECPVGRISCSMDRAAEMYLAGELKLNTATVDDIVSLYGEAGTQTSTEEIISLDYIKADSTSIYERYRFTFDTASRQLKEMSIVNFAASEETAAEDTGEFADSQPFSYTKPASLGSDPSTFTVSIMGDLYSLPAPVSAFTDNGWEIVSSEIIGAGSYEDGIVMSKNGKTFEFGIINLADKKAEIKDSAVYKIEETSYYDNIGLDIILPGNIKIGSLEDEAESALSGLNKQETKDSITYSLNTYEHLISVHISTDIKKVDNITVINRVADK